MRSVLAILLLSCLTCFGQFGVEQPFFLKASTTAPDYPDTLGGARYVWKSSDLVVGSSVSSWVDQIQGLTATNGTASKQPTNSSTGLWFDGSNDWLDFNTQPFDVTPASSTGVCFIVFKPINKGGRSFAIADDDIGGTRGIYLDSAALNVYYGSGGSVGDIVSDELIDVLTVTTNASSTKPAYVYTNGVLAGTLNLGTYNVGNFGRCYAFSSWQYYYKGRISEIRFWTNVIPDAFQLHQYRTNKYGL